MRFLTPFKENFLYFLMASFVFIASFGLSIQKPEVVVKPIVYQDRRDLSLLPVLKDANHVPIITAQGVVAIDLDSRVTLYEKNPDLALLPASTTKIMTALVAMDLYGDEDTFKVGRLKVVGQKMGLAWGEEIKVSDLIDGLLIFSANDAAEALAENYPGGREEFISEMNRKARELSLNNTHFSNPSGLDEDGQASTARDMVYLAEVAMKNSEFAMVVKTKEKTVKSVDGKFVHRLANINELLGNVPGVLGVKTGWTENARENLVTYIERDNRRVLIALLGSQDRFGETRELIDWIFRSYEWEVLQVPSSP